MTRSMVKRQVPKNLIKAKTEDKKNIERLIQGKKEKSPSHSATKGSQEVKDKAGKNAYGAEIMDRGDDVENEWSYYSWRNISRHR